MIDRRPAGRLNHTRRTAAAAAPGFGCELLREESVHGRGKSYENNGNLLLDRILGARNAVHR
ncbi:MAG: hypothetical protein P4L10_08730 [Acidobacteriaceae bacterium]|nr:hypothetical protein [Acidobacteriaceae bacterium]